MFINVLWFSVSYLERYSECGRGLVKGMDLGRYEKFWIIIVIIYYIV